ncbi:MAG: tetratricopeptide repeat protein [Calditrichia bacterium]
MKQSSAITWIIVTFIALTCGYMVFATQTASEVKTSEVEAYYDIGNFVQPVTTKSKTAQLWFNRGLAMCYAFNHEEAARCFEKAIEEDPQLAMAYWGWSYALGPNINNLEIPAADIARADSLVNIAAQLATKAPESEQQLIAALAKRYSKNAPDDRQPMNTAYSDAMRNLHQNSPEDPFIAGLFAESLMILRPWKHWSADGEPAEETPEIVSLLESALEKSPDYAMLSHLYIHVMEASPTPEKALEAANSLQGVMPGVGHLVHMPSHIYVLVGDYEKVISSNQKAIEADKLYLEREGAENFYSLYRIHNYHFLVYGAMFDGQSELALKTAREIPKQVPETMLKDWSDFLDAFMPTALHVLIRFGRWEDILAEPEPADYLPVSRAMRYYARSVAYAATNRVPEAEAEYEAFQKERARVPETSILFNNTSLSILDVAEKMAAGEIAYRKGEFDKAFALLREAVQRDDALNYDEPWGWMQPARHALGALLLEQNKTEEAAKVYRKDLKKHPKNVWALQGLAECLERQGKDEESARLKEQLAESAKRADVKVDRSCFCRTDVEE